MPELTRLEWDRYLRDHPEAHLLQTGAWGELKSSFGWRAHWVANGQAGAQVLLKPLKFGFSIAYIPKGPVGQNWPQLWAEVDALCRRERCVFLKVEPHLWEPVDPQFLNSCLPGFRVSPHTIQPPRTILVDLEGNEDQVLARMKQKTRYNIRLAEKKGIVVRQSTDLQAFYHLMEQTGERDGFAVHSLAYYQKALQLFQPQGECQLFLAEYDGQPLAGLMAFYHGQTAWYFYGASSDAERQRMPTYLLQWEAMRWAKANGCRWYDLWGVPDASEQELEAEFEKRADGLWGVYRFKRGFGGELRRAPGAWDKVYQPLLYALYLKLINRRGTQALG